MFLHQALALRPKEVITLVGAGGKTSALTCLARELASAGRRVLVTTSTKMLYSQVVPLAEPVIESDREKLLAAVERKLAGQEIVTCGAAVLPGGKLLGLAAYLVNELAGLEVDYLLIEGDGAAGGLLKAPAEYEPVIPEATTLVIALAGLEVIGKPLALPFVHRPERVASLLGKKLNEPLAPPDLASVLLHPLGGRRHLPPEARFIPLLNQAETEMAARCGREVAERLLSGGAERVVLGALATPWPVRQVLLPGRRGGVAGIVLAAGRGSRLGRVKQRLPWGRGTLLTRAVETALAAGLKEVVVVLGAAAAELAADLEGFPVNLVVNPSFEAGMSTSVRAGLTGLAPATEAALFLLADQPGLEAGVIIALLEAYRQSGKNLVAPVYCGRRGNPVLVGKKFFPALGKVTGDRGARDLFEQFPEEVLLVETQSSAVLQDIDSWEDYYRAIAFWDRR
ncbi:MAG: hypothetical protein PWP65_1166 [Clostridia bacterium]|nr:hypothetical protein [Clostridia bacterium]